MKSFNSVHTNNWYLIKLFVLNRNTGNYLTVSKQMSSDLFKIFPLNFLFTNHICFICRFKQDLELNNLYEVICHKFNQPTNQSGLSLKRRLASQQGIQSVYSKFYRQGGGGRERRNKKIETEIERKKKGKRVSGTKKEYGNKKNQIEREREREWETERERVCE